MKKIQFRTAIVIIGLIIGERAWCQSPAPATVPKAGSPQTEAGEPRASTSAVAKPADGVPPAASAPAAAPVAAATRALGGSKPKGAKGAKNTVDRVDLDTTTVTGNRELPKVMYVVPWKRSDIGDLIGRPAHSLLDEVLAPVDRNVFRREVQYYQALKPDSAPSSPQGEK